MGLALFCTAAIVGAICFGFWGAIGGAVIVLVLDALTAA